LKDLSLGKRVHEAGKREFSDFFLSRLESSFNYFEINFKRYFPYCEFFIPRAVSSTFSSLVQFRQSKGSIAHCVARGR
jgi:hypothetical protein